MAELATEEVFDGTVGDVFQGLRSYDRYPEFIPGVTGIKVLPPTHAGSSCRVRYELKVIKSFFYILNMFEEQPGCLRWNLDQSNIMKHSNGSWTLTALGPAKTKARYSLDIGFVGFVPQSIVDQITKSSLPAMMQGFQRLISAAKA